MRKTHSHIAVFGLSLLMGVCACSSHRGNGAAEKQPKAKDVTRMQPAARYAKYLTSFGLTATATNVVQLPDGTMGGFEFYHFSATGSGPYKAAASAVGLVAAGARPGDTWHEFLTAASPDVVAQRIAWLETDARVGPRQHFPKLVLLTPKARPSNTMDPAHWALVAAPTLAKSGDKLTFTAWFLSSAERVPMRWQITASPTGQATIERRTADVLAPASDPVKRAMALLSASSAKDKRWALETLGAKKHTAALAQIAKLLADPDIDVRGAAVSALATIADPVAIPHLRDAFPKEQDRTHRSAIAGALASFGDAAVPVLAKLADGEPTKDVRLDIVHALAKVATPKARAALADRAKRDADPDVKKLAATYVQTLQ